MKSDILKYKMLRKTRRLLKFTFAGTFIWAVCLIIIKIQSSNIQENKNLSREEGVTKLNTLIVSSHFSHLNLNPRDAELQQRFNDGQRILREAQHGGFKIKNESKTYEGYAGLDLETKSLVERGLVVPKWDLLTSEEPEYRNAPGELGVGHEVKVASLTSEEKNKYDKAWKENAFNGFVSDMISLHRSLLDTRDLLCKKENYSGINTSTSVIIIFHNEDWNVLLRTVHSVLDRSPPKLIKEIILVDDFSNRVHLGIPLDRYMSQFSKLKILRATKRQGLIRARLMGAVQATGDVLTFLDSHCECTKGWLEPLLKRIQEDETCVVTPVIDVIDELSFKYSFGPASATNLGGFDWGMQFTWHAIPQEVAKNRKTDIEPLRSPTMAGGLFSINRKYFERIGSYDPGMEIWGGENLELSFRIWMCGGSLEIMQCSHVGHVFRKRSPYQWTVANAVVRNSVRTALVWMDEYRENYFERIFHELGNFGDISERVELRKRLKCKSFQWYLDNIYPYQFIPSQSRALGQIKSKLKNPRSKEPVCLETSYKKSGGESPVTATLCSNNDHSQKWYLTKHNEIYIENVDGVCLDYAGYSVNTYPCHGMKGNQEWDYRPDQTILHVITKLCLAVSPNFQKLLMTKCRGADNQIWLWKLNNRNTTLNGRPPSAIINGDQ